MAYDFNSLTKQADEASNRDKFYTDFEDVDQNKLHQISELTDWMRTKAKGSDVREVIAQLFERTWLEESKKGNANMEVAKARGRFPVLNDRLNNADRERAENARKLAQKANKDEVTNVITPKGTLAYASLPASGNQVGWYYYCPDGDGTHGAGNYVWNGTSWFFGGTGDEGYNLLKEDIWRVDESIDDRFISYHSINLLNKNVAKVGYQINGVVGEKAVAYGNEQRVITGKIPCNIGDTFYVTRIDNNSSFGDITSSNFVSALALDDKGIILQRAEWVNGFEVTTEATYVWFTLVLDVYNNNKIVNITKNYYPTTRKIVDEFYEYHEPKNTANNHVIDMWGDSRTANGAENYTDIASYLRTSLNNDIISVPSYGIQIKEPHYEVNNYGIAAQASGMVASRFGSNEVYVNMYGDKINANGETNVSVFRVTTGNSENFDCWSTDVSKNMSCSINGVQGYLVKSQNTIKFVRLEDGTEVLVRPSTKVDVNDKNSELHTCIFWVGKNDMSLADGFQVNGVIGNMLGMIRKLKHENFIIIGETYDTDSTYASGTNLRGYVDEINTFYKANYPDNYIDIQHELVTRGMSLAGLTPSSEDNQNIAQGFIPMSLMQDATHMNAKGREVIAKIIHEFMVAHSLV